MSSICSWSQEYMIEDDGCPNVYEPNCIFSLRLQIKKNEPWSFIPANIDFERLLLCLEWNTGCSAWLDFREERTTQADERTSEVHSTLETLDNPGAGGSRERSNIMRKKRHLPFTNMAKGSVS